MAKIDQQMKMKIEAELRLGKKAKALSEKYDIPYVTINNWEKKIRKEIADVDVDELLQYDEVTLHHMAEEIKEYAPLPEAKKAEKLVKDVVGLKRLEEKTRSTAYSILNQVEAAIALMEEPNLKELQIAGNIVSTLHTALFNKNSTQINVMNQNNISTEKREIFRSNLKA